MTPSRYTTMLSRVTLAFALALVAAPALAQDADEAPVEEEDPEILARQVFETGARYFQRAEYERAAEAFEEAYRLSGRAALLVNIARALEALGREAEAIEALERAIREDPELEELAGARLRRLRLQQQRHQEQVEATPTAPSPPPDDAPPPDEGPGGLFWAGTAVLGVGAALLVVSIATGVASNDIYTDLEQACPGGVCPSARQGDIDTGRALAEASTATLVIGGVAAAAGAVMMILDVASSGSDEEVAVVGGPGDVGLGLRARW